ncbi:hypothetical protein KJK34_11110 [Flavobacterium sp. D11R37]|uniref:DUF6168 family protein n=1 Tax=Flavobacterium coralii TaxID=2838017 RepID=UPI001CA75C50|nr:DUF6168 family protein [Flavobacterium coralii]MBY8963303.1 hypothetical protein [Flavobacterium coralii]
MKNSIKFFAGITIATIILFIANTLLYRLPELSSATDNFVYPLWLVYLFFFGFTVIILAVLLKISVKNKEQIGYAFLFLTALKMAASYFMARPVLTKTIDDPTEKINFFVVFILFLAIEAYYTARLLNNK